jgi:ELWxxDGT repeat protein
MKKIVTFLLLSFIAANALFADDFPIHCVKRFAYSQIPFESVVFNGKMYFRSGSNLKQCVMVTEGDSTTTKIVYDNLVVSTLDLIYFQVFEDKLYFSCLQNKKPCFITIDKNEKIDSIMLQGIPTYTTIFNNKLVFSLAFKYLHGGSYLYGPENIYELNIANPNHVLLIDSVDSPFPAYSIERFITNGNKLYYTGIRRSYNNMFQLFCTSGVGTKSIQLTKIPFVSCSNSYMNFFEKLNDKIYFESIDGNDGIKLFVTDGTISNTKCITDIYKGISCTPSSSLKSTAYGFTAYKNEIYFFGRDKMNGFQLWKTNGDSIGTKLVKKINFTNNLSNQSSHFNKLMYVFNDKLFIAVDQNDSINGNELYVFDGINFEHLDLVNGSKGASPNTFFEHNKHLYFLGTDSNVNAIFLWKTNGTINGTSLQHHDKLNNIGINSGMFPTIQNFISLNGSLYFEANYDGLGWGLYRLDDTAIIPETKPYLSNAELRCYPNPTKTEITIAFTSKSIEKFELKMIDILGKTYYTETFFTEAANNFKTINVAKYPSGNYLISLQSETIKLQSKIEIIH